MSCSGCRIKKSSKNRKPAQTERELQNDKSTPVIKAQDSLLKVERLQVLVWMDISLQKLLKALLHAKLSKIKKRRQHLKTWNNLRRRCPSIIISGLKVSKNQIKNSTESISVNCSKTWRKLMTKNHFDKLQTKKAIKTILYSQKRSNLVQVRRS